MKTDKYFNITQNFSYINPIDNSINWSDSIHNYIIYDYIQSCYFKSSHYFPSGIIGVQLKVDRDILYGWVKLSDMVLAPFDGATVTIEEYACNRQINSTIEINPSILISPNPCKDILTVELTNSYEKGVILIINLDGYKLIQRQIKPLNFTRNLSKLTDGIYILKLTDGKSYFYKKIIMN